MITVSNSYTSLTQIQSAGASRLKKMSFLTEPKGGGRAHIGLSLYRQCFFHVIGNILMWVLKLLEARFLKMS
mgnify:CR=1 FL=1